jgi:hypothetical protein
MIQPGGTSRVQQDLGIPVDPLIELLICVGGFIEREVVRDDERRLGPSCNNQVAEVSVIGLLTNQTENVAGYAENEP